MPSPGAWGGREAPDPRLRVQAARDGLSPHYAIAFEPPRADTRRIRRKWLDLAYADRSPSQKLDLYLPDEGNGPFPVIVSLHGGAFMGCDKADLQILPMLRGLKRGYAVAGVNYRLSGEATFPAPVQDDKAAVRWIRAHALSTCWTAIGSPPGEARPGATCR